MAFSQTLEIVQGDTLPVLVTTIADSSTAKSGFTLDVNDSSTFAPIDVTGATIRLYIRAIGSTTLTDTITASIADGPNGVIYFNFDSDTWDSAGTYEGEIEVTFSGGGIQTMQDLIKFKVRAQFA